MSTLSRTIAVINQVGASDEEMHAVVDAINIQQVRDFAPIWGRHSILTYDPSMQDPSEIIAKGYVPAYIQNDIGAPGAGGFHDKDENGIPYIKVLYGPGWETALGHEVGEETADPTGDRLIQVPNLPQAPSIEGPLRVLCEVCDYAEDDTYDINGKPMTSFCRPEWFDGQSEEGREYAFPDGVLKEPRTINSGAYASFIAPSGQWYQITDFDGLGVKLEGPYDWKAKEGQSLRAMVDEKVIEIRASLR